MTAISSQIPYYSIHFLKSEGIYFNRNPLTRLNRIIRLTATLALELLQNGLKAAANFGIWMANRAAPLKKEGRPVIIGSGPAGYTAAIYLARAGLRPIVLQGTMPGGQLLSTRAIENYPGFTDGAEGFDLMDRMEKQAQKFGAEIKGEEALKIDFSRYPYTVQTKRGALQASALIISTGAAPRLLNVPGSKEGELWQKGVSTCAVCDGSLPCFRNQPVVVAGGGDSAMENALYLAEFASKVIIVHRSRDLRASHILTQRVFSHPKIEILYDRQIVAVRGENAVQAVLLKNQRTNEEETLKARGLFLAIGHIPNTQFLNQALETDEHGYLRVARGSTETSAPGVFACGDVQDPHYQQAVTAAGSGCMAALDAEKWLRA